MASFALSPAELKRLNNDLKDLDDIIDDFQKGKECGCPNMDELIQVCHDLKDRIVKIKAAYGAKHK